jgi:hypothetical protein
MVTVDKKVEKVTCLECLNSTAHVHNKRGVFEAIPSSIPEDRSLGKGHGFADIGW